MHKTSRQQLASLDEGADVLDRLVRRHLQQAEQNQVALLIAGGSGAGKTTLCRQLAAKGADRVHLRADNYYLGVTAMQAKGLKPYSFDDPRALDAELAAGHVATLISGSSVEQPVYSFERSERLRVGQADMTRTIAPGRVVLVDNLFAFYGDFDPWMTREVPAHLLVARVYVDAPPNVRFTRRYERDIRERGKAPLVTTLLWTQHVQLMYEKHVCHQLRRADVVIENNDWLPVGYPVPLDPSAIDCQGYTLEGLSERRLRKKSGSAPPI
jgi:uridine kinase